MMMPKVLTRDFNHQIKHLGALVRGPLLGGPSPQVAPPATAPALGSSIILPLARQVPREGATLTMWPPPCVKSPWQAVSWSGLRGTHHKGAVRVCSLLAKHGHQPQTAQPGCVLPPNGKAGTGENSGPWPDASLRHQSGEMV